ncbi:Uncharacterised protein [Mycobacteroides abscessus subsp. massiliense]|nr:Uncharacterised protein [Mycobacteroides abscessus subsp. massiliense]
MAALGNTLVSIAEDVGKCAVWSAVSRGGCSRPYEFALRSTDAITGETCCTPSASTA